MSRALFPLLLSFLWGYATAAEWLLLGLSASWLALFLGTYHGSELWDRTAGAELRPSSAGTLSPLLLSLSKVLAPLTLLLLCLLSMLAGWSLDAVGAWSPGQIAIHLWDAALLGMIALGLAASFSARGIGMPGAFLLSFGLSALMQLGLPLSTWQMTLVALATIGLHHLMVMIVVETRRQRRLSLD